MSIVVCGLDDVALRVVEQLQAAGERVVVVDDEFDPRHGRILEALGVPLLQGSARRRNVLVEAGLDAAEAVVCADGDDLVNLEVALLVHEQWPGVRLAVALTNAAVGRALVEVIPNATVLDVPSLAAPSFVEACLRATTHTVDLDGTRFEVQQHRARHDGTLRAEFGDLAPVAVVDRDGGVVACPGRDHRVRAGDIVSTIGPAAVATDGLREVSAAVQRSRAAAWRRALAWPRLLWEGSDRPLRYSLLGILVVELVSVIVLMTSYREQGRGMGAVDAVYFTTETITGVGFGDFSFSEQHLWLRLWAIALMLVGAATVTLVYAFLTNVLISRRIAESQGRRTVTGMTGHVVVIGLGAVGSTVVAGLRAAGRDVVVLDRDDQNRFLGRIREWKVPVVIGDSTLEQGLRAANVEHARAVAVVTSNDLANIETGLAVSAINPDLPVVLRVFDRQLAATVSTAFGFSLTRSTAALAAPWFVGAALGLRVRGTFYVAQQPFLVARLDIGATGALVGHTMGELGARIRVVAIKRAGDAELELTPRREAGFAAGDEAFVVGPYEELIAVLRRNRMSASA
ncbi:NAD-binding protein [Jatrophihabitans sp. YIM 134969]